MNVSSGSSTWIYYYTPFPLVHIHHFKVKGNWEMPIAGSDAFAVSQGMALFRGGYKARDNYHLFDLKSEAAREIASFQLVDDGGDQVIAQRVVGRARSIYLISNRRIFRCDVDTIMQEYA
jgi:hypothetical protein